MEEKKMKFIIGLLLQEKPHFIENLMKKKICNAVEIDYLIFALEMKNYKRNYLIYIIITKILI